MTINKSKTLQKMGIAILLCSMAAMMNNCQNYGEQTDIQVTPTLSDPHHHVVDVNQGSLPPESLTDYKIVEITVDPDLLRENIATNSSGTLKAFTTYETTFNIFLEDIENGVIMEIQGFPTPWRPFSDLVWLTDDILVFDRWSNPHYGIHYVFNIRERVLILAAPFPDQLPTQEATPVIENNQ